MNKEFKKLLLKLVCLPRYDQQWVLHQLNAEQLKQFKKLQGDSLLLDAYRFRSLADIQLEKIKQDSQLPKATQALSQHDPLYVAIILEQGQFSWEQEFLQKCSGQKDKIKQYLHHQVKTLKPATKLHVFQQWQSQLSFHEQLETGHG